MSRWSLFGLGWAGRPPEGEPVDLPAPPGAVAPEKRGGVGRALPWEAVAPVSKGQRAASAAATGALVVLAAVGVVRMFRAPAQAPVAPVAEASQSAHADTTAAASVAEQVALRYLVLDDTRTRASRLEGVWRDAGTAGWDGAGRLAVTTVYTARTTTKSSERIDVLVAAFITNEDDAAAKVRASGWVGVLVPIQVIGDSVSAAGTPAIVGLPDPAPVPDQNRGDIDATLSAQSKADAAAFVAAWAGGDATALAAPGADIPAPSLGGASASLDEWRVTKGDGDQRRALAAITWTLGDAKISSQYAVTITRVEAGGASRWQISSITTTAAKEES